MGQVGFAVSLCSLLCLNPSPLALLFRVPNKEVPCNCFVTESLCARQRHSVLCDNRRGLLRLYPIEFFLLLTSGLLLPSVVGLFEVYRRSARQACKEG